MFGNVGVEFGVGVCGLWLVVRGSRLTAASAVVIIGPGAGDGEEVGDIITLLCII